MKVTIDSTNYAIKEVQITGDSETSRVKNNTSFDDTAPQTIRPNYNSTSTEDSFLVQLKKLEVLNQETPRFISLLHHTDFEDGMSNPAIEFVDKLFTKSPSLLVTWLYSVYACANKDSIVIDGLLRIIAFIEMPYAFMKSFLPMIELALNNSTINCQESAVMLCEVWRTSECLELLKHTTYTDPLIQSYAESIILELIKELGKDVA